MRVSVLFPPNSIRRKLLLGISLIGIPPLVVLFYQNYYALGVLREKAGESYQRTVSQYLDRVDGDLSAIDRHLRALADSDTDVLTMAETDDENAYRLAKNRLSRRFTESTLVYPHAELFFSFSQRRTDFLEIFSAGGSFVDRLRMREVVRGGVIIGPPGYEREREWRVVLIEGKWFLIRAIQTGTVLIGAWCRIDQLLRNANIFSPEEQASLLFTNEYGEIMTDPGPSDIRKIEATGIHEKVHSPIKRGVYLVVGTASDVAPLRLHAIINDHAVVRNLPNLQWLFLSISAATVIFFALGALIMLRTTIVLPLERMLGTITSIRDGEASGRIIPLPSSDEFRKVTDAFNAMMSEIDQLRISVYEEQLAIHREELLRLRAQVDPHFFLNSINMIYSLISEKDYERVSEAMLLLSNFFSFSVRNNAEYVPLGEELGHIEDYFRIQQLRFNDTPRLSMDAPDFLLDQPVPPLIIQTFVENSFQHGGARRKAFKVAITVDHEETEGSEYIAVRIEDNGAGFSAAYIDSFSDGRKRDESKDHIGIKNAQRRLELIYKGRARLAIGNTETNGKTKGSWVRMLIPMAESGGLPGEETV
ncbi:MAG: histidine kinase [Treponemataceae bacterium]